MPGEPGAGAPERRPPGRALAPWHQDSSKCPIFYRQENSMTVESDKQSFQLIKGEFTPGEATEVLMKLINDKISFHQTHNWSRRELGESDAAGRKRIEQLTRTKEELAEAKELEKRQKAREERKRLKNKRRRAERLARKKAMRKAEKANAKKQGGAGKGKERAEVQGIGNDGHEVAAAHEALQQDDDAH